MDQASFLIDQGVHPIQIADKYEEASRVALAHLDEIASNFPWDKVNHEILIETAMTTLASKFINKCHRQMAELAVKVCEVCYFQLLFVKYNVLTHLFISFRQYFQWLI